MTVNYVIEGDPSATGITVTADVSSTATARLAVSTNPALTSPVYFGPITPATTTEYDPGGNFNAYTAKITATNLLPATRYYWGVEHNSILDTANQGTFRTLNANGTLSSGTIGVIGDAGLTPTVQGVGTVLANTRLSNHTIYATIAQRAIAENWSMVVHAGDAAYYDPGLTPGHQSIPSGSSGYATTVYRRMVRDITRQPNQQTLLKSVPVLWVPDDHDRGPNNHDRTFAGGANFEAMYRERWPHPPLSDPGGVWQAVQDGRVLIVASDGRHGRDPNTDPDNNLKEFFGTAQLDWMENLLFWTTAKAVIWILPNQWLRTGGEDTLAVFNYARSLAAQMLDRIGWSDKLVMVNCDRHANKITTNNPWGGWPVMVSAPLDADGGTPVTDYPDGLPDDPGSSHSQYGTVSWEDLGDRIVLTMTAWRGTDEWGSTTRTVPVEAPPIVPGALARTLSGSHRVKFEARVCTEFQISSDPDGIDIPILEGDVQLDGTANIRGTLQITTSGEWPRRASSLLAPYGNEIFVRAGVDVGPDVIWIPLGYYRINSPEQDNPPRGPIRIGASDRMASIIDSKLESPREFSNGISVATVFRSLVNDIYPDAVVVFDDDTGGKPIGRNIIVEEDRYAALADVAVSFGKIMHWDGQGFLQVRSAPAETESVWDVRAGRNGVLITSARRVTREGIYNGVVAEGDGTDDAAPVRALAVDDGATSPTRWGGRFGKVPKKHSSPLITTVDQARDAAEAILRKSLGAPYSVDFGSISNPSLQPFDPVLIEQSDGNREIHVIERMTIPLSASVHMTASTREKTLVIVKGIS